MWLLLSFVSNLLQKLAASCFLTNQGWFAVVVLMIKCNNDLHPGLLRGEAHRMTFIYPCGCVNPILQGNTGVEDTSFYTFSKNIRSVETRT